MNQSYEFLMARADEAAAEAVAATLDNVKHRALRSAAAWRGMADRARRVAAQREKVRLAREDALASSEACEMTETDEDAARDFAAI